LKCSPDHTVRQRTL